MSLIKRFSLLVLIGALHVLVILICRSDNSPVRRPGTSDAILVTLYLHPRIRDSVEVPAPDVANAAIKVDVSAPALHVDIPEPDVSVSRNMAAGMAAPTIQSNHPIDMRPFLTQAALLPGNGATVVLRVEVLESGEPGRIQIDVSSGSRQVDQAAMDYARTRRWFAGYANGAPRAMWIRWSVRLQA